MQMYLISVLCDTGAFMRKGNSKKQTGVVCAGELKSGRRWKNVVGCGCEVGVMGKLSNAVQILLGDLLQG